MDTPSRPPFLPPQLTRLFWAFSTEAQRHAGTTNQPVLILGNDERDVVHFTAEIEGGVEDGSSHLMTLDVDGQGIQPFFQYMRIGLRGSNAWSPRTVFVFGEMQGTEESSVMPIAIRYRDGRYLSTDPSEGRLSVPLARAGQGDRFTALNRLLILIQNGAAGNAGTTSPVSLTIEGRQERILQYEFPKGTLIGPNTVFLEIIPLNRTILSRDVIRIQLNVGADDSYTPNAFFLFGLDDRPDQFEQAYPFVFIPDWSSTSLGTLSEDPEEGTDFALLYQAFL